MNCDQAKEVGPAIMYKTVGQEIKSSHSNALLKLLPWPRTRSSSKLENYRSSIPRPISLALVLTSGGGDGLPISLTKIMGYELSQFPASLFETEYLMLATNKPQIIQMLIKAFYKLEGADRVVQKMNFRVI